MHGTARDHLTGRLDVIVYRSQEPGAFYVSEYATSYARAPDMQTSVDGLAAQIKADISSGIYPLPAEKRIHTFVTLAAAHLELRDGARTCDFMCRVDELEDYRGRRSFEAICPTNYLSVRGQSIDDVVARLAEVISARYFGESMTDLMREMPRRPLLTTLDMSGGATDSWSPAVIQPDGQGYTAMLPEAAISASGKEPLEALRNLESALAGSDTGSPVWACSEPFYFYADVALRLREQTSVHSFLMSVTRFSERSENPVYLAFVPHAGVIVRAPTFERAISRAKDAIFLEFIEKSVDDVRQATGKKIFLSAVKLNRKNSF